MVVVDTNVLVYAADADSPHQAACARWLEQQRARPDAWFVTWSVLYEFLRVTTHPRVMRKPCTVFEAWRFVEVLLTSPGLDVLVSTERHVDVATRLFDEHPDLTGNLLQDPLRA